MRRKLFCILWVVLMAGNGYAGSILPNGDVELMHFGLLHWDYSTMGASVYNNPSFAQSGTRCLKLDYTFGDNQEWTHRVFAVEPGQTYLFRGYYRVVRAVSSGSVTPQIRWFKDYKRDWTQLISQEHLATGIGTAITSNWVAFEKTIVAPPDAVAADLTIWSGAQGPQGEVYFDNLTMEKTSGDYSATVYMLREGWSHLGSGKYWSASTDFLSSLAGMLAQLNTGEYIFLYGNTAYNDSSYRWALGLATFYGARLDFSFDHPDRFWDLVNHLKHHLPNQEYIKFSYDVPYTCRWAMSLAGLEQCLAVEESIAMDVQSRCGMTERESLVTGWTESQAWERYRQHPDANRKLILENFTEYPTDYRYYLGDLAVCEKAWFFWDPDRGEPRATYLNWMDEDSRFLGCSAGDEGERVSDTSIRGVVTIPADWSWNLATKSRFADLPPRSPMRANPLTLRDIQWEDNVNYCTFLITDGDNLQVLQGGWSFDSRWWASPSRGQVAMGWQLAPSLTDYAPVIFPAYFDEVSPMKVTPKDCYVIGVSGDGVFFVGPPSDTAHTFGTARASGSALITRHAERLNEWMKAHAINIITGFTFSRTSWRNYDFANYATALERPLGFLVDTYTGCYVDGRGELKWAADGDGFQIPVKSADYALWDASCGRTAAQIAGLVNAAPHSGPPVEASFKHIAAHAWSWMELPDNGITSKIRECAMLMNDYVRVVRPDEFLMQMRLRLQTTQELNRYHSHLAVKTDELDTIAAPTSEAAEALLQARQSLTAGADLIATNPEQAFALFQQADLEVEVARLSFLSLEQTDERLFISCPSDYSPLYHYSHWEVDSEALPVRLYRVQVDTQPTFANPELDMEITASEFAPPFEECYVRVKAQGSSHGDWGHWSAPLHYFNMTAVSNWHLH